MINGGGVMRRAILAILPLMCACEGEAEKAVRSEMLDPDAAQFRDVERCPGDRYVWRGEVNGKNRFGAFVGFKPFYYSRHHVAFHDDYNFNSLMDRCNSNLQEVAADTTSPATSDIKRADDESPVPTSTSQRNAGGFTPNTDLDYIGEGEVRPGHPNVAETDYCWDDYCPCDRSNPDYGYLDISICRKQQMGVAVSDGEYSIGAQSRDARKALREFDEPDKGYSRPLSSTTPTRPTNSPTTGSYNDGATQFPNAASDGSDILNEEGETN